MPLKQCADCPLPLAAGQGEGWGGVALCGEVKSKSTPSQLPPSLRERGVADFAFGGMTLGIFERRRSAVPSRRGAYAFGAAVEPRSISSKVSVCCSGTSAAARMSSSSWTARTPISRIGWATVVSGGVR